MIEVHGLKKTYGDEAFQTPVLRGLTCRIDPGEFVAIMGPSGSGKSTFMHILGLLDKPSEGSYTFNGQLVSNMNDDERALLRNKTIGFVFQAFHLLPRTSALDNVALPLLYGNVPMMAAREQAREALASVGLSQRLEHDPSELSGGERQRVAIARAIVNNPHVIFADEPTGNLDSVSGHQVMELLNELHRKGHTIIVVTHETVTAAYAHRRIMLKDGLIVADERRQRNGDVHYQK